jgi:hypothetical protein
MTEFAAMVVMYPAYTHRRIVENPRDIITSWFNNGNDDKDPFAVFENINAIAREQLFSSSIKIISDEKDVIKEATTLAKICLELDAKIEMRWMNGKDYPFSIVSKNDNWIVHCIPYRRERSTNGGIVVQNLILLDGEDEARISMVARAFKRYGYGVGRVQRNNVGELVLMTRTSFASFGFFGIGELYPIAYKQL